jgi:hypothetical protein
MRTADIWRPLSASRKPMDERRATPVDPSFQQTKPIGLPAELKRWAALKQVTHLSTDDPDEGTDGRSRRFIW